MFLRTSEEIGGRESLLSILDLTLVGAAIVESHQREALALMEGVALDTRTGRVLLTARGEGTAERWTTLAAAGQVSERLRGAARRDALERVGQDVTGRLARAR